VAIVCPHCDHPLDLHGSRTGRAAAKCPECDKTLGQIRLPPATDTPPPKPPTGSHLFGLAKTTPDPQKGKSPAADRPAEDEADVPPPSIEVRGYRIEKVVGKGGMGTVYLARQLSLDRPVALKVMGRKWSADPVFAARFTREAYAAAQLAHPNIVPIYDIGEVDGCRFFSMEYVPGTSLAELVRTQGKLDPETAVGYILQAARGLKHAHDRGLIHRDVKPDNLLLDEHGLIKVADLGLVKETRGPDPGPKLPPRNLPAGLAPVLPTPPSWVRDSPPSTGLTGAKIALGTPAYMSPEQCRDAATVDHRADVYSLGCTLYVLVTGQPPFDGQTAVELMTKHAYEPIVPPEEIVQRVPRELSDIIQRMLAKDPAARFQSMGEVVRTLEAWLGVQTTRGFAPSEDQISRVEEYAAKFHAAPAAVFRGRLTRGFFAAAGVAAVLLVFFSRTNWAVGVVGLMAQAAAAYFVLDGVTRRGYLFTRVKQFAWGLAWGDWAIAASLAVLGGILFWAFNVLALWAGFGLIGVGLAFAVKYGLDRAAEAQRKEPLDGCERLLRRLRKNGADEEGLRLFVAKYAGPDWEELFEALFGFEAKLAARAALHRGGGGTTRNKYAAWREPLLHAIDRIETARKDAREKALLRAVELARLQAAGMAEAAARSRAEAAADRIVRAAGKIRQVEAEMVKAAPLGLDLAPTSLRTLTRGSSSPDLVIEPESADRLGRVLDAALGRVARGALAAVLLVACGAWMGQNGLFGENATAIADPDRAAVPLAIPGVPPQLTVWADGLNVGFAGLLLAGSLFYRGHLSAAFVLLGAGVMTAAHHCGIRAVEPLRDYHVALLLGSLLALVGYRAGTRT
jgi:serine/threonine protein kinase